MSHHSRRLPFLAYLFLTLVLTITLLISFEFFSRPVGVFSEDGDHVPFDFFTNFQVHPSRDHHQNVSVLVLINSVPKEVALRDAIRDSWANVSAYDGAIRVEFLIGQPDAEHRSAIRAEQNEHDDIIIANIDEGYYELSVKTMAMLVYKARFYPKTKCLVKADSDNVLMLPNYLRLCEETVAPRIVGKCDVPRHVIRMSTKWAVPKFVFADELYPAYCSTGTYTFIGANLPQLLINKAMKGSFATSRNFRRLSEDVIFTGILAEQAGVARRHVNGLSFFAQPEFECRNSFKHTYSIHMNRDKNPTKYYHMLKRIEGERCRWWNRFSVRRWT
ncbi:unnamed protein product [Caenorhabditis bovis]|uniref:Hexosyltransferase n=1 Tax=Caenorhabditis bovis TaxID=2654633 RepID=A0A8S1FAL8_9PELO|nr:unnamed protein product [Caenorhabditis bovis]